MSPNPSLDFEFDHVASLVPSMLATLHRVQAINLHNTGHQKAPTPEQMDLARETVSIGDHMSQSSNGCQSDN